METGMCSHPACLRRLVPSSVSSVVLANRWLIAVVWVVNTEAVFSLLVPLWDDGIQFSTWRRANALAHDDGMFTFVDYT